VIKSGGIDMERKYAVITGFLGQLRDRFAEYQPARGLEEILDIAARIKGASGVEVVYPQNFRDPEKLTQLLEERHLPVSSVNLNVKAEEKWRFGSFSHPDPAVRKEAVGSLKTAMDSAAELGCHLVTTALLNDGADYPFELDYVRAFDDALAGISEAAEYRTDVRISLEYKASEPRAHCLLNTAGKTAYFCSLVGKENVGVTLDVGHALQCGEIPADSAAFLGATGKLFYVHINDNYRNWDWDLVPGTVNLWDYLEFILYLKKVGYDGWITADVFPQRHEPIRVFERTFEWLDFLFDTVERMDQEELFEMLNRREAFDTLDYVRGHLIQPS
jgi:xylose isomerase